MTMLRGAFWKSCLVTFSCFDTTALISQQDSVHIVYQSHFWSERLDQ